MVTINMARKPYGKRLESFSAVALRNIAADLGMFAAQLEAIASEMDTRRLRGVEILGKSTPERMKTELVRFVSNAQDAINKTRLRGS